MSRNKTVLTEGRLVEACNRWLEERGDWPSVRDLTRLLRVSQRVLIDLAESSGRFKVNASVVRARSDWTIELQLDYSQIESRVAARLIRERLDVHE